MTRLLAALLCMNVLVAARADDTSTLLADVTARHRDAVAAIQTVSFAFERAELKAEPLAFPAAPVSLGVGVASTETGPGRYWQTPERWRSSAGWSDGTTLDEVYRHHTLLSRRSRPNVDVTASPTGELTREHVTPWSRNGRDRLSGLLLGHTARDTFAAVPFHHLLEQPHKLLAVERLPGDDVRVELSHSDGRYEFWFSAKHGHLIRRRVWQPADDPDHRYEVEVTRFAEPNRGQFFPLVVENRTFEKGAFKSHDRLTLSEVEVNRPIPNEVFRIPDIAWTVCKDLTRQRSYQVDADGYRLGGVLGVDLEGVRAGGTPRSTTPVAPAPGESDAPLPWWVWAVIASLTLCLIAAVMEIHRLRTTPPPAPSR